MNKTSKLKVPADLESPAHIELKDILDVEAIQSLMDDFYAITNFGIGILDLKGEVLVGTGWQEICTKFHRLHPETLRNCIESDTYLTQNVKRGEFLEYKCKNNLRDIVTPIFVSDQHVGNLFLGQFMYEDELPEFETFLQQAEQYNFNKEDYISALNRVPRWSREKVRAVMSFYSRFARIISDLLTSNLAYEKALDEKEKLIGALNRSNKELEQFAYVASHDLQEPLRMVSSYTKLLEKELNGKLDEKTLQHMGFVVEGAKRMHSLIKDLLSFSRVNFKKAPFVLTDLNQVMEDVLKDLGSSILESNAEIKFRHMPVIKVNRLQIKQLFQNLLSNAIKFRAEAAPLIEIDAHLRNRAWTFSVKDNGIGINPEYYDKIFILFQRLHARDKYPGTGIGLSICKKIVELHHGKIWIESEPGKGSTFYFTISD